MSDHFIFYTALILLVLSGFFSALETAITSLSQIQLHDLEHKKDKRSRLLVQLMRNPEDVLITLLLSNNLVNISLASLVSALTIRLWGEVYLGAATGILTLLILILGEVTPKRFALNYNKELARKSIFALFILQILFHPVVIFISHVSNGFLKLLPKRGDQTLTFKSLLFMGKKAAKDGGISAREFSVISNLSRLKEITIKDICTHRSSVFSLPLKTPSKEALKQILEEGFHSYIPLYEENQEHIVGVVHTKDVVATCLNTSYHTLSLHSLMVTPLFLPASLHLDELFDKMYQQDLRFAVVLDEYGGLEGVVTPIDLTNTVWGIGSSSKEMTNNRIVFPSGPQTWLIRGEMDLEYFAQHFNKEEELKNSDSHTIAGYLMEYSNRIPQKGDFLTVNLVGSFEIVQMHNNKVLTIRFTPS